MLIKAQTEPLTYRYEQTYYLTHDDYDQIKEQLRILLPLDNTTPSDLYWINKIYFDSPQMTCYRNGLAQIDTRFILYSKYFDNQEDKLVLELVEKQHHSILKKSYALPSDDYEMILVPSKHSFIKHLDNSVITRWKYLIKHEHYQPVLKVRYLREAFTSPFHYLKITFDTQITATKATIIGSEYNDEIIPIFNTQDVIMTLKYRQSLPSYLMPLFSNLRTKHSSVSIYESSVNKLNLYKHNAY